MQPVRPHGQVRPSLLTTMWPISPAPPRPSHSSPSSTTPPPTPVPQNTPRIERNGFAAPSSNSAIVATLTSLESATGAPNAASSFSPSGYVPSQSGRLRALVTVPAASSTTPGEPTPIASSSPRATPAFSSASRTRRPSRARRRPGRRSSGSGARDEPSTSCSSSTTTAWIFVPPRSMPPYRAIRSPLTRSRAGQRRPRSRDEPYGRKRANSSSAYQRSARVRRMTSRWSARR